MRKIATSIMMFMLIIVMVGCGENRNGNDIIDGGNLIRYKLSGVDQFGFTVNLLTNKKIENIKIDEIKGENIENVKYKYNNDTYDELKDYKYKGYYLNLVGIVIENVVDYVKIDEITLNIDGENHKIKFETPIIHNIKNEDDGGSIEIRNFPLFISTSSYKEQVYSYDFYINEKVIINSFGYTNFLEFKDVIVKINGNEIGKLSECLPLVVEAGTELSFQGNLKNTENNKLSNYNSIYTEGNLTYQDELGEEHSLNVDLISQSVSNVEDAKNIINLLIEE